MSRVSLLGPQRLLPTVGDHLAAAGLPAGPVALVTAGWQEREDEDTELREALPTDAINLRLYARWEQVLSADPDYFALHRKRQDRLRQLQRIYQMRLAPLMASARALLRRAGSAELLDPEREHAIGSVRSLDAHHLGRLAEVDRAFEEAVRPGERGPIADQRAELRAVLDGCSAALIAGGHVAVLLNRFLVFGMDDLLRGRHVIAWSAGAMALADRVVVFHDAPPQGAGDAEVLGAGLGLAPGIVALPHARHRLHLDDPARVALMARRFGPARCVPLDDGDAVHFGPDGSIAELGRSLHVDGAVLGGEAA